MKAYRQFLKELPSKKVVFAFGRFQPPTNGHELLVKAVEKIAKEQGAAHVIYASHSHDPKKNPLPVDRKVYYLKRMFPDGNFKAAGGNTRTFIEVAKELNKKFKNIIMVAGSDRVPEYKKILEKYNGTEFHFDTVSVISAGERDPDSDTASGMSGTKMREAAKKGDFNLFKQGLPHTLTTVDAKRLMNEIRSGMGMDQIKEQVKLSTDWLRESYFRGEIYKIGQIVESGGVTYEILSRGSNYLTVVDSTGNTHRKWLRDVTLVSEDYVEQNPSDLNDTSAERQISYKGYQTKNFDYEVQAHVAFQRLTCLPDKDPVAILNAVKATDDYLGLIKQAKETDTAPEDVVHNFATAAQKAQEYLAKLGDLQHHADYINTAIHDMNQVQAQYHADMGDAIEESMLQFKELIEMKFNASDKIKVARIIAGALGVSDVEKTSNPEQLVNSALRKIRSKPLRPEYVSVLNNMLATAKEAGIEYDAKLVPSKVQEAKEAKYDSNYQDTVKRVGEKAKQGKMKTVWVPDKHGTGGRYKVVPVAEQAEKPEVGDTGKVTFDTLKKIHGIQNVHTLNASDKKSVGVPASPSELRVKHHRMHEESELDESMTDSWKKVQSMDKGSVTGGKKDVQKHLTYLHAVHAHHKKFGNDTKKVKDKIESINRSRIAEDTELDEAAAGHTIEAHGIKGAKGTPWRKTFKSHDHLHDWAEKNDSVQIHATRELEGAKKKTNEEVEYEELTEDQFDQEIRSMVDVEHVIEAYDDEEFMIIDEDTGEELSTEGFDETIESETVMREGAIVMLEISRMERVRRKQRFARTQSKREVRAQIALRKTSSTATISKRARRLATSMIKKRLLKKDASKATLPEKERVEKFLASRKAIVDRLAKRVAPRIRQIEKARLQHKKVGK